MVWFTLLVTWHISGNCMSRIGLIFIPMRNISYSFTLLHCPICLLSLSFPECHLLVHVQLNCSFHSTSQQMELFSQALWSQGWDRTELSTVLVFLHDGFMVSVHALVAKCDNILYSNTIATTIECF